MTIVINSLISMLYMSGLVPKDDEGDDVKGGDGEIGEGDWEGPVIIGVGDLAVGWYMRGRCIREDGCG
jgi:hypothetical protein